MCVLVRFQTLTLQHDPGTSDDSGRASERLTTSSVAPRDADSSRDRLSDVSDFYTIFMNIPEDKVNYIKSPPPPVSIR